jgi:protoheme IX farnesyltransferase
MLSVLFFWQFPHFIAIAWIYRKEYSKAGLVMVTTTDPTGQAAGRYSVLGAWLLFAVSFIPLLSPSSLPISLSYAAACAALGVYQLGAANDFRQQLDDAAARRLLKASIIYLPLALGLIAVQTAL